MAVDPAALQRHLEGLAQAYGSDLTLPGTARSPRSARGALRAAAPARTAVPRAPAAHWAPPPAPSADRDRAPQAVVRSAPPAPTAAGPTANARATTAAASPQPGPAATGASDADPAAAALLELRAEVLPCTRCKLHRDRRHVVFGEGNPHAEVLFIGEAPGAVEDQTGRPFVGPAGQLLDRILAGAMGLQRGDVYIANINKCRPPGNRAPEADEVAACLPYLRRQVAILAPRVIVCLGRTAAQNLLGTTEPMRALRGRDLAYDGIPVVVTWHPAYLLRDPSHKRETWDDIKRVNRLLGRPEVPAQPTG